MKKNRNPYRYFDKYVLRSPLLSINFYKKLTEEKNIDIDKLKEIYSSPLIKESIFLASPSLQFKLEKWFKGELVEKKEVEKLTLTLLKYLSRMSSRCTPFGIFAGCGVGEFSKVTNMKIKSEFSHDRHTRLDMSYLVALAQDLVNKEYIRNQLLFFPNTSIYKVGDSIRYIEYKYVNGNREHNIKSVKPNDYIQIILNKAQNGLRPIDLANILLDNEITIDESLHFINLMIDKQLLTSELEPSISGDEFLNQIFTVLNKLEGVDEIIYTLKNVEQMMNHIDSNRGGEIETYIEIVKLLESLGTGFNMKYLFQTDMILGTNENNLDLDIAEKAKKALTFLNKMSLSHSDTPMNRFKQAFKERYENRKVSLSNVLDVEMGIGYIQKQDYENDCDLIDGLVLQKNNFDNYSYRNIEWNKVYTVLLKKLLASNKNKEYIIDLVDGDFSEFEECWEDLPDSMYSLIEIININGKETLSMSWAGGTSGAKLLSRFCYADKEIFDHVKSIINVENNINKNKILAEVLHLPQTRTGNVLMRPILRDYEIPYLTKSLKKPEHQLLIDDLMISIKKNQIIMESSKNNKEVIPRFTNAHNYKNNSLPIYHFLGDLQLQNNRLGVSFDWGPLSQEFDFLPRITYESIIISKATWNLTKIDIRNFLEILHNEEKLLKEIKKWRKERQIPKFVVLQEGDNELLINMNNYTCVKLLLSLTKNKKTFKLVEFLFLEDENGKSEKDYFANQVVISFFNEQKLNKTVV